MAKYLTANTGNENVVILNQIWNWIVNIPVAIWGSLIAGTMTLAGVVLGQYGLQRRQEIQKKEEIKSLKNALIAEIRAADEFLQRIMYLAHDIDMAMEKAYAFTEEDLSTYDSDLQLRLGVYHFVADYQTFSSDVYEANTDKIGLLDPDTSEAIVRTYNQIESLHRSLQRLAEAMDYEDLMLSKNIDWTTGAGLSANVIMHKEQIESTVGRALMFQKITLYFLGEQLTRDDRVAAAFAMFHMDPQTEEEASEQELMRRVMDEINVSSVEDLIDKDSG